MINLEISERYRKENSLARVYGFILFNNSHPNIIKVLRDDDYWNSFHKDSDGWIIFSIKPNIGHLEIPEFPEGMSGMLIPIWKEPNENTEMLEFFDMESTQNILPCMVIFAIGSDKHMKKVIYPLKDITIFEARNSIKSIIKTISDTIKIILPEYRDSDSVMREVIKSTESKLVWEDIKDVTKKIAFLNSLRP